MVIGAIAAIRQTDLKLLLAYGTVSQLGFMVALIGLGYTASALAVLVAHALFKAALFLIVGVVDKASGTRDVRKLTGVAARYPLIAIAGVIGAASMAGIPPALGFVTKEAAFDLLIAERQWVVLATIAAAAWCRWSDRAARRDDRRGYRRGRRARSSVAGGRASRRRRPCPPRAGR